METFYTVAAPGLDGLVTQELRQLGLLAGQDTQDEKGLQLPGKATGGVEFTGEFEQLYRANLHLRTASRVLIRLGEFYAAAFSELRKKAGRLPWERYLSPGQPVSLHVTCHRSRLYHSDAVAERVAGAIGDRLGQPAPLLKPTHDKQDEPSVSTSPQLIVVRLASDLCTISIDSSGELLHRRGYRLASAKAPLRETLAAAMILASGWDVASPLIDPFCGSGTIAIEAALLALGLPPGCKRRFAFMDWPGYDPRQWESLLAKTQVQPANQPPGDKLISSPPLPLILASDRDAGAIRMARANAERAGVSDAIQFSCRAISAIETPISPGWIVTNPPYGRRVSADKDLRNLYAQIGHVLRAHCPGWRVALLCSDLRLLAQTRLHFDTSIAMVNGGVNVRLARGQVPPPNL